MHRERNDSARGLTIWLTGLPSAGKTTLGRRVAQQMRDDGDAVELLDGDLIRSQIGRNLGFSRQDREENLRRIAFVADLLARNGIHVVIAAISPYRTLRAEFRTQLRPLLEVYVNAPVAVCEKRDVKGLYGRFRKKEIQGLTGMDDIYEPPLSPEVECRTDMETVDESFGKIMAVVRARAAKELVEPQ